MIQGNQKRSRSLRLLDRFLRIIHYTRFYVWASLSLAEGQGIADPGGARVRVSAYADYVSTFVSSHSDIEVVLNPLERYENVTGQVL